MVRFKNRWLLVELIPLPQTHTTSPVTSSISRPRTPANNNNLDGKTIWAALRQSVLTHFGDVGWGAVAPSLTIKYFSPTTSVAIIRVSREHHKIAWAALTLLSSIDGVRYIPHVVHLSGTIKHAQLAAIEHNRVVIARFRALSKSAPGTRDSYDAFLEKSGLEIEALQD
ncbi:hypothetical protein D9611_001224 [Ephemerocybe angulata]|uniref:Ribonuclease P/MRP protein subunit POP5 n=1 Tax=Ephemerocybe angulata TaxID=980116 RepID=A0A8H5CKM0_9AGAR|nr:hypothetical protein D9611_001224 [Tulosesus angulatus]